MTPRTPAPVSRLPEVGTTVFTVMSALAQQHGAVNLGQGFPDFDPHPALPAAVAAAMAAGHHQYPPMAGVAGLREAIAAKVRALHGHAYDPGTDITVTAGATQALLTALLALVHPGDEVIVLDPCYDSYDPGIRLAGGTPVHVPLGEGYRPDFARIAAALGPRTRAIVVNTPHNPSGTVWTLAEREALAALLAPTDVIVIADEVYEHMVYDGGAHLSVAGHPALAARSVLVSSFGKTYHVTGWKVGFAAAPAALMAEFRKVHQFNVFTVNTPMQHALAACMADPSHYLDLSAFYQRKRDRFRAGLARTALRPLACEGTYFQSVSTTGLPADWARLTEMDLCRRLTTEVGVAAIPMAAFHADGREAQVIRLCFAKRDETLDAALERLTRHLPAA